MVHTYFLKALIVLAFSAGNSTAERRLETNEREVTRNVKDMPFTSLLFVHSLFSAVELPAEEVRITLSTG